MSSQIEEPRDESTASFERVCAADDVLEDEPLGVLVGDMEVAVARSGDEFFAIQDLCSHAEVALSEGDVEDCTIECWLHGSRFDLRTGKPTGLPATEPVATFPIEVRADGVYVDVTTTLNGVRPS
jgi:3-phenylpropionate/trans-cinnamate dioxygenase ferredoxin subunit